MKHARTSRPDAASGRSDAASGRRRRLRLPARQACRPTSPPRSPAFRWSGGLIFYILEKQDQFVRFYAMQSIIFGGIWFLFNIVSRIHRRDFVVDSGAGSDLRRAVGICSPLWSSLGSWSS